MKAWTLFKTRGVRAAHGMHGVPGRRRRQVLTFERCDTHDRTVFRGAQSLWYPDPGSLDDVHERRVDVRFGPRQGSDLPMIGDVSARCLPRLP
jgi:hypothetical protein